MSSEDLPILKAGIDEIKRALVGDMSTRGLLHEVDKIGETIAEIRTDIAKLRGRIIAVESAPLVPIASHSGPIVAPEANVPSPVGAAIDALTAGRLVTLAALGAIICLTVGGSCWVAQTGKLPTEFGQLAGQEASAAVVAEEPEPTALTAEELQQRKAEAREAAIEMFQEILGPDAE